jgi:hypothetical protein
MAILDVWVAQRGAVCRVDDHSWLLTIFDAHNNVFQWAGITYADLPAPHAHWSGKLPPGTYVIQAVNADTGEHTDHAIIAVECDDAECVRLFVPNKKEPPDCKIHIEDAVGILGPTGSADATSIQVTGTAAGCKKIKVTVDCLPGKGQTVVVVGTGGKWQADVPLKPGCRCGGKLHVTATCVDNPKCADEFDQPKLRCDKSNR